MKVLFINPPFTGFGGMEGHGGRQAPLNLAYLASYLRAVQPHHEIAIFDGEAYGADFEEVNEFIKTFKPQLVGLTMPTPAYLHVLEIAKMAKEYSKGCWVVVGGPHPSAFASETTREENIDFSISGEGEMSFSLLIKTLETGGSLESIGGLAYKTDEGVHYNTNKTLIDNLDDIPFPARDLLPMDRYVITGPKRVSGRLGGNMITSRGCPYDCTYCDSKVMWTRAARLRSVGNIVDEIQECKDTYGIGEINFHDDIFPMSKNHTIEVCKEIQRRKIDIRWVCMNRVNFCYPEVMEEMYKAGCRKIMFGFESGSNEILKLIKKKATIEQAQEAVKICRSSGIKVMGSFMIGNIGEDEHSIRQTIDFSKSLDLDTASFFVSIPFPGTELFTQASEKGYLKDKIKWSDFCVLGTDDPPMVLLNITPQRVLELQAQALKEFYLRPKYILKKFFGIRSIGEFWHLVKSSGILKKIIHNVHESGNSDEEKINIEQKHKEFLDNLNIDPVIKVNDLIADEKIYTSRKKVQSDLSESLEHTITS